MPRVGDTAVGTVLIALSSIGRAARSFLALTLNRAAPLYGGLISLDGATPGSLTAPSALEKKRPAGASAGPPRVVFSVRMSE